ncbi:DUF4142 domain-containing protein [Pandoraea nosoerga]|uniref:DUF4142 domain-containing protein n=1 Tax=Pandoraea nosoerga TaxID=2508296 RepID=A0A5E4SGY1_9BURK|nr:MULTISPECIES: DUF4142 domain-containing protein [Pandoraea]MBN4665293.1 DUF4142 domain-containing protein [Pandoraea nosoerga]MBN4674693.1 DUF4142 domain-containing protein [Pandoraea nosoerga]MBN4680582.1 DUF4142 domain-containing protein [Pandoraea nosoerga]MBN4743987.1 DUF4142 domain-containing protein [Pandoraea nosoerga]VVD75196.1 hypothetical protein PNO31109_00794 [Pandoraea nosoerga]
MQSRQTTGYGACLTGVALLVSAAVAFAQGSPRSVPAQGSATEAGGSAGPSRAQATRTAEPTTGIDVEFVDKAQKSGKTEVQASQLAVQRSSNPSVKRFAQQMVTDHSKANETLRQLAAKKGVSVPNDVAVNPDIEALKRKSGREFDVAYLALAGPDAHEQAVTLFETESEKGQDSDLRGFARQTLPTLRHHLSEAREVSAKIEMGK